MFYGLCRIPVGVAVHEGYSTGPATVFQGIFQIKSVSEPVSNHLTEKKLVLYPSRKNERRMLRLLILRRIVCDHIVLNGSPLTSPAWYSHFYIFANRKFFKLPLHNERELYRPNSTVPLKR